MSAPNEDDIEEEYDEDFEDEEETKKEESKKEAAPAAPPAAPKAAAGGSAGSTYTFVLFEGEDEKGEIKLATNAKWGDFLSAAKAKMGYEVGSIKYDDDFGENKEQDIVCKTADDWEDVMAMMEEDAEFIKGELSVEVTKAGGAAAAPAAANAKISIKCFVGDDVKLTISVTPSTQWSEVSSKIAGAGGYTSFEYDGPSGEAVVCKDVKGWQACLQVRALLQFWCLVAPDAAALIAPRTFLWCCLVFLALWGGNALATVHNTEEV